MAASWKEIERFRKDIAAVRPLAKKLLTIGGSGLLSSWEMDFLQSLGEWRHELTTRQVEKLLQIRDGLESITEFRGFSVKSLLEGCWLARLDLSEDDEEWIDRAHVRNATTIRRCHIGRLMRCARALNLVEEEMAG